MIVKFLKAGSGDCILIQHDDYNILIDGGNESTHLLNEARKIHDAGKHIDLLIITHHDDDHIKGIIDLLMAVSKKEYGNDFIREIMFNSPKLLTDRLIASETQELSFTQAVEAEEMVVKFGLNHLTCNSETEPKTFGSLTLNFLAPTIEDLATYKNAAGAYLSSDYRCDWENSLDQLNPFIDDLSQDNTLPNQTSIVILVECEGRKILLTGDVTPSRFESILDKLALKFGHEKVLIDYVKLPHHGSYRSLNKNILSKIICDKFIISTNSKKHFLPNKRGLLKVIKHHQTENEIEFLFNYEEALANLKLTAQEAKKYRFKLTKNNNVYGLSI